MIKFENACKEYQRAEQKIIALNNVNLYIPEGKIFGIIGGSGAGKSSLLRCVNGLETLDSGNVRCDNVDISSLSPKQLQKKRSSIGMIFQHFNLLNSRTVFKNIALPLEIKGYSKAKIAEEIPKLLSLVDLNGKEHAYPQQLSGGQQQRVAIARALASKPKVLLCDEATSALDPQSTQQILKLLRNINASIGITILLITHELDVVKSICDDLALMDHGKIIETGDVISFFSSPKTPLGTKYVNTAFNLELPQNILSKIKSEKTRQNTKPIIKISFAGQQVTEPILSTAIKKTLVDINILISHMEPIRSIPLGYVIAELRSSSEQQYAACIQALSEHGLKVEVLGYVC